MDHKYPHNTEHSSQRQEKIEDCLLENMLIKPYDKIGIADMCRQMGVSRQLFYTYFPDKDSCLVSLVDRIIRDSMADLPFITGHGKVQTNLPLVYLSFWREQRSFLEAIVRQNLKGILIDRCFLYFKEQGDLFLDFLSTPDLKADDNILWLYVAIRFTVIFQWHEQNYTTPVEEMSVKYLRMLKSPIVYSGI